MRDADICRHISASEHYNGSVHILITAENAPGRSGFGIGGGLRNCAWFHCIY